MTAIGPSWHGDAAIAYAMHLWHHQEGRELADYDLAMLREARSVLQERRCYVSLLGRFIMGVLGDAFSQ